MSFIHYTVVGHFDPTKLFPNRPIQPLRPLSAQAIDGLLTQSRSEVRDYVDFHDGYITVQWAPCPTGLMKEVHRFAYRLAEQEQCIAAESPLLIIGYPESAHQIQRQTCEALMAEKAKPRQTG
jgi:hypothetical protein